jgi:hypothetical protein
VSERFDRDVSTSAGRDGAPGRDGSPRPTGAERRTEARFDEELRRAARSLITEELPMDILDPALAPGGGLLGGGVRPRMALPGVTAAAASLVVLLLASAVALAPGTPGPSASPPATESLGMNVSPKPTSGPVLRSTGQIRAELVDLGYACNDGPRIESPLPGPDAVVRDSAICEAPAGLGPLTAAVVVGEAAGARVVLVNIKADIVGEDTPAAREAVAQAMAKAAALVTVNKADGSYIGSWIVAKIPALEPREGVELERGGLFLRINRSTSGAFLFSADSR